MVRPTLPSARSKAPRRPLHPTAGLGEDRSLPLCLGSQPRFLWSLGSVTVKEAQRRHWQVRQPLGRPVTVPYPHSGHTSCWVPCKQPFLSLFYSRPRPQKGEVLQGQSSQGTLGTDSSLAPPYITLSSSSEVHWRRPECRSPSFVLWPGGYLVDC